MPEAFKDPPAFDVLQDVLDTLRFHGSIFFRSELAAPWGIELGPVNAPRFHIVLAGECFVGVAGADAIRLMQSDLVLLPGGPSHWIADRPGRELIASERAGEACELGNPLFQNGDITNRLMCGIVHFDRGALHPILDSLPGVLHFPGVDDSASIGGLVGLMDNEIRRSGSPRGAIVDRLSEVLFLQILNRLVDRGDLAAGFLAALRDRRVYRALAGMHARPDRKWSLDELGREAGMSRATLLRRFEETLGTTPMKYLTNWRLSKAYSLVRCSAEPLDNIAEAVGFTSARSLNRAFERVYELTPAALRRRQRHATR